MPGPTAPFLAAMLSLAAQLTGLPLAPAPAVFISDRTPAGPLHSKAEGGVRAYTIEGAIYLSPAWRQGDPEDDCILLHEAVHVLQYRARRSYACPAAAERLAYAAQELCLSQRGLDFWSVSGYRPATLAPLMECGAR